MLNIKHSKELSVLILTATKPVKLHIDDHVFNDIKTIVKSSNENVKSAFDYLFQQFRQNNSQEFIDLGIRGKIPGNELPPPTNAVPLLRDTALKCVETWYTNYGQHYKQLTTGYHYLKYTLKMYGEPNPEQQSQREEERQQAVLKVQYGQVKSEYKNQLPDIQDTLDQMRSCFDILVPEITSSSSSSSQQTEDHTLDETIQEHGLGSALYEISVDVPINPFKNLESEENAPIFDTLRDCLKLAHKHQASLLRWLDILHRVQTKEEERLEMLNKVTDLNNVLCTYKRKCEDLNIKPPKTEDTYIEDGNEMINVLSEDTTTTQTSQSSTTESKIIESARKRQKT